MENKFQISKTKALYTVICSVILIIIILNTLITEPTRLNLILGLFGIILFGMGGFVGINRLSKTQIVEEEPSDKLGDKNRSLSRLILGSVLYSGIIMVCAIVYVYMKEGNLNNITSFDWVLIISVFIILTIISAFVNVSDFKEKNRYLDI